MAPKNSNSNINKITQNIAVVENVLNRIFFQIAHPKTHQLFSSQLYLNLLNKNSTTDSQYIPNFNIITHIWWRRARFLFQLLVARILPVHLRPVIPGAGADLGGSRGRLRRRRRRHGGGVGRRRTRRDRLRFAVQQRVVRLRRFVGHGAFRGQYRN